MQNIKDPAFASCCLTLPTVRTRHDAPSRGALALIQSHLLPFSPTTNDICFIHEDEYHMHPPSAPSANALAPDPLCETASPGLGHPHLHQMPTAPYGGYSTFSHSIDEMQRALDSEAIQDWFLKVSEILAIRSYLHYDEMRVMERSAAKRRARKEERDLAVAAGVPAAEAEAGGKRGRAVTSSPERLVIMPLSATLAGPSLGDGDMHQNNFGSPTRFIMYNNWPSGDASPLARDCLWRPDDLVHVQVQLQDTTPSKRLASMGSPR